mmetsp:Transcript_22620/g.44401  ORF Transcript_22620/g.44401 Transcript_22620/m.44401 type:complete len:335 (+) Transcript_22620:506-1510(+)|eukprot:CAMPEP_0171501660 /NCGR_PEP_ID=MMETSP0958-20121227/9690_1 /TAXON_ID=87120 /ORGANISM="Aurantiochytrium limacinum, Strain ATCCMYA-1381" /LENGTH=334 /DNA_ID=CAMNT_0012036517 /DNA_START=17 /DNA_END=1021 /DNA_ORIENTATION=-
MFSKSSRFDTPGSGRNSTPRTKKKAGENCASGANAFISQRTFTRLMRDAQSDVPSYMCATTSSTVRKNSNCKNADDYEELPFQVEEDGPGFMPLPKFGKDTKGSSSMKRGKHGRFSMAGSVYTQSRGTHSDSCGLGHDEGNKKAYDAGGYVPNMTKKSSDRFGKGSYLQTLFEEGATSVSAGTYEAPSSFPTSAEMAKGTSAFRSKAGSDRSNWIKENTYMRDRDLAACEGLRNQNNTSHSDFERKEDVVPSSIFKNTKPRFAPEPVLEQGQDAFGPTSPTSSRDYFEDDARPVKSSVVYRRPKHSRFSEYGSMYNPLPSEQHKGGPHAPTPTK